jgi:predicted GH43/DUF377 family glycosyl hydrolase
VTSSGIARKLISPDHSASDDRPRSPACTQSVASVCGQSEKLHFWNERKVILTPKYPWELVQLGNCGSPVETDAGWLVLGHGVGPMRKYCISALLLANDPCKVIGRLRQPLIQPDQSEREGYVPNVVYTCGSLLRDGALIISCGLADHATGFATVRLDQFLAGMEPA